MRLAQRKGLIPIVLGLVFLFVVFSTLHEFGHWLIATLDGAKINSVAWFPYIDETGVHSAYVNVNEFTFSSISTLVFFLLMGFLITFTPFCLIFVFLYQKKSVWWSFAFLQLMASFAVASNDFLSIGRVIGNIPLGIGLFLISNIITMSLFIWLVSKIYQMEKA